VKARKLEEGITVRCNKRVGVVTLIRTRVAFQVQAEKGASCAVVCRWRRGN
jgi:hypothetical protein